MGAGTANAGPAQDSQYVSCVSAEGLYSSLGPSMLAARGRMIANHISSGIRTLLQERNWVYYNTNVSVDWIDANVLVNCATHSWLGYGSEGTNA